MSDAAAVAIARARELRAVSWYVAQKRHRRMAEVVSSIETEIGHLKSDNSEGAKASAELLEKIAVRLRAHRQQLFAEWLHKGAAPDGAPR